MRRRFFLFQTVTLIVALVALLLISSVVTQWTNEYYRRQAVPAASWQSERVQEILGSWTLDETDWDTLNHTLESLGYQLVVEDQDDLLYSTLDLFQQELYEDMQETDASWPSVGTLIVQNQEGMLMIGRDMGEYTIVAVQKPQMPKMLGQMRPQSESLMLSLLISGSAAIVVIVFLSLLFLTMAITVFLNQKPKYLN